MLGATKKGRKVVRFTNSNSRPPNSSSSPSQTPISNHTSSLHNSHANSFSSPINQTPVFNSDESPQTNVEPPHNLSSPTSENPQNLDHTTEANVGRRGKIQIWPDDNGYFCPEHHRQVVRQITEIYEGKFDGAYPSWGKVPLEVRDLWFNELKKYFWWEEHYDVQIRQRFEGRGKETLKDTFKEVRKKPDKRPDWLHQAVWDELWVYWKSDSFKKKSVAAKVNRASTTGFGSNVHTGGSIPMNVHKMKMIAEGQSPTLSNMYLRIHQDKDNQWVDEKSAAAHEKYVQRISEIQATQPLVEGSNPPASSELPYDEQMKVWVEVNGCSKRGRVCGFGAEGDRYTNSLNFSSKQNRGNTPLVHQTVATLVEENKKQKVVLDDVHARLEAEQARSKKQSKKLAKCAKATQDMQAQMKEWHLLMKAIHPNIPEPRAVVDSLSASEDDSEDSGDDGDHEAT